MNQNNRKVILSLYRSKLKLSHNFGYQYGKWDNNQINNILGSINKKKLKKKHGSQKVGSYIMNNVRYRYKMCMYEKDNNKIEYLIDDGFYYLKKINNLCNCYI